MNDERDIPEACREGTHFAGIAPEQEAPGPAEVDGPIDRHFCPSCEQVTPVEWGAAGDSCPNCEAAKLMLVRIAPVEGGAS
jgi:hypothetical protein